MTYAKLIETNDHQPDVSGAERALFERLPAKPVTRPYHGTPHRPKPKANGESPAPKAAEAESPAKPLGDRPPALFEAIGKMGSAEQAALIGDSLKEFCRERLHDLHLHWLLAFYDRACALEAPAVAQAALQYYAERVTQELQGVVPKHGWRDFGQSRPELLLLRLLALLERDWVEDYGSRVGLNEEFEEGLWQNLFGLIVNCPREFLPKERRGQLYRVLALRCEPEVVDVMFGNEAGEVANLLPTEGRWAVARFHQVLDTAEELGNGHRAAAADIIRDRLGKRNIPPTILNRLVG